jgi:hypothetical protein
MYFKFKFSLNFKLKMLKSILFCVLLLSTNCQPDQSPRGIPPLSLLFPSNSFTPEFAPSANLPSQSFPEHLDLDLCLQRLLRMDILPSRHPENPPGQPIMCGSGPGANGRHAGVPEHHLDHCQG